MFILLPTFACGLLYGRMTDRWGPRQETLALGEKLQHIPTQFGNWTLESTRTMDESSPVQFEPAGYIERIYKNNTTSEWVSVLLLLGRPGPVAVHTPEVCMSSRSFVQVGPKEAQVVSSQDGRNETLWAATFRSRTVDGHMTRVYWGWSGGDRWEAAANPRWLSAGRPYLYKIQLACNLPHNTDTKRGDPCARFLAAFLPVAQQYLSAPRE